MATFQYAPMRRVRSAVEYASVRVRLHLCGFIVEPLKWSTRLRVVTGDCCRACQRGIPRVV